MGSEKNRGFVTGVNARSDKHCTKNCGVLPKIGQE